VSCLAMLTRRETRWLAISRPLFAGLALVFRISVLSKAGKLHLLCGPVSVFGARVHGEF